MKIRISEIVNDSVVDGPGIRLTVFTQGCFHKCVGCHNPETHNINGGRLIEIKDIISLVSKNPLLDGITISGGEPFLQSNAIFHLAKEIKEKGLSVIIYTGFLWEDIQDCNIKNKVLEYTDIIVDGKFHIDKRSLELDFKGSSNQRTIDVKKSLELKETIEI